MSIKVMSAILEHSPSRSNKLLALLILGNNANDDGWAFPGQDDIAKHCRVTKRAIQYTLDGLEDDGEIIIYNRIDPRSPEQHYSNCYHLPKYGKPDAPPPVELRGELHRRIRGSETGFTTPSEIGFTRVAKPAASDPSHEPSIDPEKSAPPAHPVSGIPQQSPLSPNDSVVWVSGDLIEDDDHAMPQLYPCTAADINALIAAWWEWVPKRPVKRGKVVEAKEHFANKANRDFAETLTQRGVMPADMAQFLGELRHDTKTRYQHCIGREMTFVYAAEVLQEWIEADRAENYYTPDTPRITPRKPGTVIDLSLIASSSNPLEDFANHPDFYVDVPPAYISPHQAASEDDMTDTYSADDATLLAELGAPL